MRWTHMYTNMEEREGLAVYGLYSGLAMNGVVVAMIVVAMKRMEKSPAWIFTALNYYFLYLSSIGIIPLSNICAVFLYCNKYS